NNTTKSALPSPQLYPAWLHWQILVKINRNLPSRGACSTPRSFLPSQEKPLSKSIHFRSEMRIQIILFYLPAFAAKVNLIPLFTKNPTVTVALTHAGRY